MILSFCMLALFIFYTAGGFRRLLDFYRFPEPEPEPLQQVPEPIPPAPRPEPVKVTPAPVQIVKPAPVQTIPEPEPLKPAGDRRKLERTAANLLTASGCKFDVWTYVRFKSDFELMDIITNYNLNK